MHSYQTRVIGKGFRVCCEEDTPEIELSDSTRNEIGKLWQLEIEKFGEERHAGKIFSFLSMEGDKLQVREVEFKHYVAQLRNQSLKKILKISPVGVSGVLKWNGKVLVGKRSEKLLNYPGLWELVPAGTLAPNHRQGDTIDYLEAVKEEFVEETGLDLSVIRNMEPFLLVHETTGGVWDICVQIELKQFIPESKFLTGEYKKFQWIPALQFIHERMHYVPSTLAILQNLEANP